MIALGIALLGAILASCAEETPPPLPAGALLLHRDGMLRAGQAEVADPVRLMRARLVEGPVSVAIDPEADVDRVARLLEWAGAAGLGALELTGVERVRIRLSPRPMSSWEVGPGPRPTPPADASTEVEGIRVVARPGRSEILVRAVSPGPLSTDHARQLKEALQWALGELPAHGVVSAFDLPRTAPWNRVAGLVAASSEALGDRVVRHELTAGR